MSTLDKKMPHMEAAGPRVSVGLPVYNGDRYLRTSIESILSQTYSDFEFIIVDNASTDNTEQICREYAAADKRITYYRNEKNIGGPRNFNRAFELSRGTYLKWATSDDYVAPEYIQKCLEVLEANPDVVLCYPRATLIDAEGQFLGKYDDVLNLQDPVASHRFIHLLSNIKLAHQHVGLIRCEAIRKTSLHGSHIASDINFLAELSLYGKFYELPEYLLFRRFHPGSSSWERTNHARQVEFSDPDRARIRLDKWEAMWNFFAAVRKSPTPTLGKCEMYFFLFRRVLWNRESLGRELRDVLPVVFKGFLGHTSRKSKLIKRI
jgi:glycosyltransferase involved in cell wall biosynthesis